MARRNSAVRTGATVAFLLATLGSVLAEPISGSLAPPNPGGNAVGGTRKNVTPMHKVLMTQRGYIQFLRWELPVPEIEEFTFCLWVKSTNLTYAHSIFSYSKDEKDRLVRSWISSYGKSVHLEINNVEIFAQPTYIEEHRWYHICVSWDNRDARFALWVDGQKLSDGYATKMAGHVIPSKGDIVVGQEYTDFDKGLEEGIEGAVLGFNLLLASAFASTPRYFERNNLEDPGFDGESDFTSYAPREPARSYGTRGYPRVTSKHAVFERIPLAALGYSGANLPRRRSVARRVLRPRNAPEVAPRSRRKSNFVVDWRINSQRSLRPGEKPLGQRLVETSFANCQLGRGSPRIDDKLMLISWTRTAVRVFGGAVVKNAKSDCGQF